MTRLPAKNALEFWPIDRPKPYPGNPRRMPDKAVAKVAASIREFGFQQPIVVDSEGVIIAGHTRLAAAKQLKLKQLPVIVASDLTAAQVKAYRLADNRVAQETSWLNDLLKFEVDELNVLEFDLSLAGFDPNELSFLLTSEADLERAEQTPEVPDDPVCQPGDLWLLGTHRVLCGDATNGEQVNRLLNGAVPHLMVTDPPYGFSYNPGWRDKKRPGTTSLGRVLNDDNADWREAYALFPGDVVYLWSSSIYLPLWAGHLDELLFERRALIVWKKQNFSLSRGDYHWAHENCWYAVRQGKKSHWAGDRKQSTVWEIETANGFIRTNDDLKTDHSAQKPVECMRRPILNSSLPGDGVYDPFLGSGTTLIAAEMEGRVCCGLEINPAYVDVIVQRWQNFTGKEATLDGADLTFAAVRERRENDRSKRGASAEVERRP